MAQVLPGRSSWQRYFRLVIGADDVGDRVRSGMSVQARILSYHNPSAVLVPRVAVRWDGGKAYVQVSRRGGVSRQFIELGRANHSHWEVLDGAAPGLMVVQP